MMLTSLALELKHSVVPGSSTWMHCCLTNSAALEYFHCDTLGMPVPSR